MSPPPPVFSRFMELSTPPSTPGCGARKCWPRPVCMVVRHAPRESAWSYATPPRRLLGRTPRPQGVCMVVGHRRPRCYANECVFNFLHYIFGCIRVVHCAWSDVTGYLFYMLYILLLFHSFNDLNPVFPTHSPLRHTIKPSTTN